MLYGLAHFAEAFVEPVGDGAEGGRIVSLIDKIPDFENGRD
jgi:hypothetical protein